MTCPTCQAEHAYPAAYCPRCGTHLAPTPLHDWNHDWNRDSDLIEGTIVTYETSNHKDQPTPSQSATPSTSLVVARPALPSLPARLWRQPAVRAAARAGAGALALTLGLRLLRGTLTRPRAASHLASSALPVIQRMLDSRPSSSRSPFSAASNDGAEVVETFIYIRRVVRHH